MSKHTPPPWAVQEHTGTTPGLRIVGPSGGVLAIGVSASNAPLIATAPDLLLALKTLLGWADIQDHHSEQARQVRDAARTAIAKAEGRPA